MSVPLEVAQRQGRIITQLCEIKEATKIFNDFQDFIKSVDYQRRDTIYSLCCDYLKVCLSSSSLSQKEKEGVQRGYEILNKRPFGLDETWRK